MRINIKKLRDDLWLTQEEFAEILEINRTTVYNWEKNKNIPRNSSIKKVERLCRDNDLKLEDYENI